MFSSLRQLSWLFSIALHLLVLLGGMYVATSSNVKVNLDKKMYEVNLVGTPHKGKAGKPKASRPAELQEPQKPVVPKEAPPEPPAHAEPKKPEKKIEKPIPPTETAKLLPEQTVNATKAAPEPPKKEEPKKEEPKKEPPKKEEPKKEEPKKEEPKAEPPKDVKADAKTAKDDSKNATKPGAKQEKAPSKAEILAQALGEVSKTATKGGDGTADKPGKEGVKGGTKGGSGSVLSDALADLGREVGGRGTKGDGHAEDGPGEGESTGTLDEFYATQVIKVVRQNWRFPRMSNVVLVTQVELSLSRNGDILKFRIVSGSGRPDFDTSVQRALEDTKRLPKVPESLDTTLVIKFYNTQSQ